MSNVYKKLLVTTCVVFCYLSVEWFYNQHLLVLLAYDYINPEHFRFTEIFGKAIASFGLNLIINGFFKKFKPSRFLIGLIIAYVFLTFAFNYAVNAFSNQFRYSSYYSMLYRQDVINENDEQKILKFTENKPWYEKSLVMAQFVYVLKDNQWKNFEKKLKEPINKKINTLNNNRHEYFRDYKKFDDSYEKIMKAWGKYSSAEATYLSFKGFFKGNAKKKFIQKVGLPPDLSFDEFVKKTAPEYIRYSNFKLFEGNPEAKLNPIYLKDLPKNMNEVTFNKYLDYQIKKITTQLTPDVTNIRDNRQSFDSLAILVIPPISICLSLFSIFFNIFILIAKWSYHIFKIKKLNSKIYSGFVITALFTIVILCSSMQTTLTEQDSFWKNLKEVNHEEHPVLFSVFTTGLKLEPILCLTEKEPKMIKVFTDFLYPTI